MLPVAFLGSWVKRHVARRGVGVFAQLTDAGVRVFPVDLVFSCHDGVADFIGIIVGQRCAGIDRPAAVVDAGVLLLQIFISAGLDRVFTPAKSIDQVLK